MPDVDLVAVAGRYPLAVLSNNYHSMVVITNCRSLGEAMAQSYKNVYFTDCPQTASGRSSLTLAFGAGDRDIFETVRHLSSDTLRNAPRIPEFHDTSGECPAAREIS